MSASSPSSDFNSAILVICKKGDHSHQIRMALKTLGYNNLVSCTTHTQGLERIRGRNYQFVIFDSCASDMPVFDFVEQAKNMEKDIVLVAASTDPRIDDVFGLLKCGARGFLALPFCAEGMERVVDCAQEGPPFSDAVLQAPDRNAALAGVALNNLYRLAVLMRQGREFESAAKDIPRQKLVFAEAVEMGLLFCEGGDMEVWRDCIVEDCILRASAAASRLGRTRQKLKKVRQVDEVGEVDEVEGARPS